MYKIMNSVQDALCGLATQTTNILNSLLFTSEQLARVGLCARKYCARSRDKQ